MGRPTQVPNDTLFGFSQAQLAIGTFTIAVGVVIIVLGMRKNGGKKQNRDRGTSGGKQHGVVFNLGLNPEEDLGGEFTAEEWPSCLPLEVRRDFVRTIKANTDDVYFAFVCDSAGHPTGTKQSNVRIPYTCHSHSRDNGEDEDVLQEFQKYFKSQWVSVYGEAESNENVNTHTKHRDIVDRVARFVSISTSMKVVLDYGSIPALFQPTYTITMGYSEGSKQPQVRVVMNAFIGGPAKGPPNPSLKYTSTRVRVQSCDLVCTPNDQLSISYVVQNTKQTSIAQVLDDADELLEDALETGYFGTFIKH